MTDQHFIVSLVGLGAVFDLMPAISINHFIPHKESSIALYYIKLCGVLCVKMGWENVFVYRKHPSVMLYQIKEQSKHAVKKKKKKPKLYRLYLL